MVKRGVLDEPTTAAHLAKLTPKGVGGKMSMVARADPAKAKYLGQCCRGSRVWGERDADVYVDADLNCFAVFCCGGCKLPLPLPLQAASPVAASPVTLTGAQKNAIEEKRQAALARKRAREESPPPPPPPPQMHLHAADAPRPKALYEDLDWAENGTIVMGHDTQSQYYS
jgi:hypothetical protein